MNRSRFTRDGYSCFKVFTLDRSLDLAELEFLLAMALEDHVIDADEKAVLQHIISEVAPTMVQQDVWARIEEICKKHEIVIAAK